MLIYPFSKGVAAVIGFIYNLEKSVLCLPLFLSPLSPVKHLHLAAHNPGLKGAIEVLIASDEKLIFHVSTLVAVNG